jgi:hypothetical protein
MFMMTLVDLRILRFLAGTFEFWFLQIVNLVSFAAACFSLVNEADGAALYSGNERSFQLSSDICWNFIGLVGSALVGIADAVLIRRSLKLGLSLFWIACLFYTIGWRVWFTYQQPYMVPLDVCIWIECFSVQVIRLQTSMTFAVFAAKYAISLFRFPRALVILKSAVVMRIVGDESNQTLVDACILTNFVAECDAVISTGGAAAPDSNETIKQIAN